MLLILENFDVIKINSEFESNDNVENSPRVTDPEISLDVIEINSKSESGSDDFLEILNSAYESFSFDFNGEARSQGFTVY